MHLSPLVLLVALATGCASAARRPTGTVRLAPFSVSSIPSAYGVQGRFDGTASVHDEWIDVILLAGALRVYQSDPRQYRDVRLRAAVATCASGGREEIASESRAVHLAPAFGIAPDAQRIDTTTYTLRDTLRFEVAVPRGDVRRAWVTLIVEWAFENEFASYQLHTDVTLSGSPDGRSPESERSGSRAAARRPSCR